MLRAHDPASDRAYLRPIVRRLGAAEVHRLVDLVAVDLADEDSETDPSPPAGS